MNTDKEDYKKAIEKIEGILQNWQELVLVLGKEQSMLHKEFSEALDKEKMKKVLDKLKDIED